MSSSRVQQSWFVTIRWTLTVLLAALYPQDAYSETPQQIATWDAVPLYAPPPVYVVGLPPEPSVFQETEVPPVASKAAARKKKAVPGFVGTLTAGPQVSNRDEETDAKKPVVRLDVRARVRVTQDEDWQPRLRLRAQFGGVPTGAVNVEDPATFREFAFDGGLFERVAPGLEVGVSGGVSTLLVTDGKVPDLEGPARWAFGARMYSDDEESWIHVYVGQDQRLPRSLGWTGSAAVGVDAGYLLHKEGRVAVTLAGDFQRSLYSDGALVVRIAVVARVGSRK